MTPGKKMHFYFILEFRLYLELSSVSVGIKTFPYWICYECVQFQIEIRKTNRCGSRSPDNAEFWSFHVAVLRRTAKTCTKNYNARAQPFICLLNPLFDDVLIVVAVAVVFCGRSLIVTAGRPGAQTPRSRFQSTNHSANVQRITGHSAYVSNATLNDY